MPTKKNYLYRDFAAGVYLSDAQNPVPSPPPANCYVYSILIHTRKGRERVELQRRREGHQGRVQITKLG
jgi:hypothetical protein